MLRASPRDLESPSVVIAHGAWADATSWREVIALLQARACASSRCRIR